MCLQLIMLACCHSRQLTADLLPPARTHQANLTSSTLADSLDMLQPRGLVQGFFPLQLPLRIRNLHADKKSS